MELGDCLTYSILVVGVTSLWVYFGRKWSFSMLANAMFFPTLFTVIFIEKFSEFFMQMVGVKQLLPSVIYSVLAVVFVYFTVWSCVGLDLVTGWGKWVKRSPGSGVHAHNSIEWQGFLRAAGEEIGWRCYLLPCLMNSLPAFQALLFRQASSVALKLDGVNIPTSLAVQLDCGLIWGLFHVAVMVLLVNRIHPPRPYLTVAVQCTSVALCAFPSGWLAIRAGYSVWPSTVMHFFWNRLNPRILGSIYTHDVGLIEGSQWLINGEGLAGCLVMIPLSALVVWDLS